MEKEIMSIVDQAGWSLKDFCILSGAQSEFSEIHINLSSKRKKLVDTKYAIQFEYNSRLIVLAYIENRIKDKTASLDIGFNGKYWKDYISLSEYTEYTQLSKYRDPKLEVKLVLMNIDHLYDWLIDMKGDIEDDLTSYSVKTNKEGRCRSIYSTRYERDPALRKEAAKIHGYRCCICEFDFEAVYGVRGRGFIEIHHIKPLNMCKGEHLVNAEKDMISVCSNCHRMIHREKDNTLSPEELKAVIKINKNNYSY